MNWRSFLFAAVSVLAALLVLAAVAPAQAEIVAGTGDGDPVETVHEMTYDEGWVIGSDADPVGVTLDPNAGPWVKTLVGPDGGPFGASDLPPPGGLYPHSYTLREHLVIQGNLGWEDWHQEIVTPGWDWGPPITITADGNPVTLTDFVHTPPKWEEYGGAIDLYFDELAPGTKVIIGKMLFYDGDPDEPGNNFWGTVTIKQYPTPEPSTVVMLLGVGVMGLLSYARRRNRTA